MVRMMGKYRDELQAILAIVITVAFVAIVMIWMFHPPAGDTATMTALGTLTGVISAAFATIVYSLFGSSHASTQNQPKPINAEAAQ